MIITIDVHFATDGVTQVALQTIDTANPACQAVLTSAKAGIASQTAAGLNVMSNHPQYPGKTRWQVLLGEVVRLNDTTARTILGV